MSIDEGFRRKNNELQALRAVAICMVLVSHLPTLFPWAIAQYRHIGGGMYVGVDLFLCLSGYVITKSLLDGLANASGDEFWKHTAAFWVRRLYRITPSAWFWLALPMVVYTLVRGRSNADIPAVIAAVLHVANIQIYECAYNAKGTCSWLFTHYWSLSLEEQFYLVLPLLFFVFKRRTHLALIALVVVQFLMPRPLGAIMGFLKTDALLFGVLIALWSQTASYKLFDPRLISSRLRFVIPPLLLLCLVGVARYEPVPFFIGLVALVSAIIVWLCSYDRGYFIGDGLMRRCLVWIGERSFSIYLSHPFGYWATTILMSHLYPGVQFNGTYTFRFAIAGVAVVLTLSELSYRLIEVPFRRRGAKRSSNIIARPSVVAGA
jgi:peptidoglycan/LPS O-acetylase OafA/YrhL